MRLKFLNAVMKPGMLMEKDFGSVRFHSPPGFSFRTGHAMEFYPAEGYSSTRIWGALWKNRGAFDLFQCQKPCSYCQRVDLTKFSKAGPAEFRFDRNDQKRWR